MDSHTRAQRKPRTRVTLTLRLEGGERVDEAEIGLFDADFRVDLHNDAEAAELALRDLLVHENLQDFHLSELERGAGCHGMAAALGEQSLPLCFEHGAPPEESKPRAPYLRARSKHQAVQRQPLAHTSPQRPASASFIQLSVYSVHLPNSNFRLHNTERQETCALYYLGRSDLSQPY